MISWRVTIMIKVNFQTAEQVATKMENAADSIKKATSNNVLTDNRTTLTVNQRSQEANNELIHLTNLFHHIFQTTIKNIQSTATEFKRLDEEIDKQMNNSLRFLDITKDLNTYQKAKNG
mgnify:CR=1 FL=1